MIQGLLLSAILTAGSVNGYPLKAKKFERVNGVPFYIEMYIGDSKIPEDPVEKMAFSWNVYSSMLADYPSKPGYHFENPETMVEREILGKR